MYLILHCMSVQERCGVCGGLVEVKDLRACVECRVRFCPICKGEDDDLCIDCFEEEQEEEESR